MFGWLRTIRAKLKRLKTPWNERGTLELTEDGFQVVDRLSDEPGRAVRWSDVRAIRTYKRDLWTTDMICLAFQLPNRLWMEINEEAEGFRAITTQMEATFPTMSGEWFGIVMKPAFAPNDTLLYRQDDSWGEWEPQE